MFQRAEIVPVVDTTAAVMGGGGAGGAAAGVVGVEGTVGAGCVAGCVGAGCAGGGCDGAVAPAGPAVIPCAVVEPAGGTVEGEEVVNLITPTGA